jgi:hypothetical protein
MVKGKQHFLKTDLKRAIESAREADLEIARIDVHKDGGFSIIPKGNNEPVNETPNEWDAAS